MTKTSGLSLEILDAASQEIIGQALYYREASPDSSLDLKWDHAVGQTVRSILSMQERGSRCNFSSPELEGMRWIPIAGFPKHIVFYLFWQRSVPFALFMFFMEHAIWKPSSSAIRIKTGSSYLRGHVNAVPAITVRPCNGTPGIS
jgi:hypothetical protein